MAEDDPESSAIALADGTEDLDNRKEGYKDWSIEDKIIALAALDLNGGNVYRTAKALEIPYSNLNRWAAERKAGKLGLTNLEAKEKRGNLRAKMESVLHSAVEAMPSKLGKATFSQVAVGVGILTDKIRMLRSTEDENPTLELCRILGCTPDELPPTLQLAAGPNEAELPDPSIIETQRNPDNPDSYEPADLSTPRPHSPDCPGSGDACDCGASAHNLSLLQADNEEPIN